MGCSIQLGVKNGRGVIVKPGSGNDVSRDQICVRGRFGYDQVRDKDRLHMGRLGRGADTMDAEPAMVIQDAARRLAAIIREHGAESVGLLGSGQATNEDNYLLRQLAAFIGHASSGFQRGPGLRPRGGGAGGRVWQRSSAQPSHGH